MGNDTDDLENPANGAVVYKELRKRVDQLIEPAKDKYGDACKDYIKLGNNYWKLGDRTAAMKAMDQAAKHATDQLGTTEKSMVFEKLAATYSKQSLKVEEAHCRAKVGACYETDGAPKQAAKEYRESAEALQKGEGDLEPALEWLLKSAVLYGREGLPEDCEDSVKALFDLLALTDTMDRADYYSQKVITACHKGGLDPLASKLYIRKMDLRRQAETRGHVQFALLTFRILSKYGEDWRLFARQIAVFVFAFALAYLPSPFSRYLGPFAPTFTWGGKIEPFAWDWATLSNNLGVTVELSINVFSTLGLIDVQPTNIPARVLVCIEVLLGVLFIANLGMLIYRHFFRN